MAWRRDLLPNVEQCEERGDRLDFQYELFSHNNIRLETVTDLLAFVEHRNGDLSRERDACAPQLDTQCS